MNQWIEESIVSAYGCAYNQYLSACIHRVCQQSSHPDSAMETVAQADGDAMGKSEYIHLLFANYITLIKDLHAQHKSEWTDSFLTLCKEIYQTHDYQLKYFYWKGFRELFSSSGLPESIPDLLQKQLVEDLEISKNVFIKYTYLQYKFFFYLYKYKNLNLSEEDVHQFIQTLSSSHNIKVTCWVYRILSLYIAYTIQQQQQVSSSVMSYYIHNLLQLYQYHYNLRYRSTLIDCIAISQLLLHPKECMSSLSRVKSGIDPKEYVYLCFICFLLLEDEDCDLRLYTQLTLSQAIESTLHLKTVFDCFNAVDDHRCR